MVEIRGFTASPGLAMGRVHLLSSEKAALPYQLGSIASENGRLSDAISIGAIQLRRLVAALESEEAAIIEFQLELLDDQRFLASAFASIKDGASAVDAWRQLIEREVAEYRAGGNTLLSARADDLIDLEERITRCICAHQAPLAPSSGGYAGIILVADSLTPSRFLEMMPENVRGIATAKGSPASHVSILAKARRIPMIVGCGETLASLRAGENILLDADGGVLLCDASPNETTDFANKLDRQKVRESSTRVRGEPAITSKGDRVKLMVNLDSLEAIEGLDAASFDGVGLFRSEMLFSVGASPTEEEQYRVYRRVITWAKGRPVTIRILDAGGDKPVEGVTLQEERNPFLGIRGIRLLRHRPGVFRSQMRALARAAVLGDLRVLVPMVSVPEEMGEVKNLMRVVVSELQSQDVSCRLPSLGMMVEVPSAALCAADFDVDFYSIGTNDLIQYTLAAARDEHRLSHLARADNPAVLALISQVAGVGRVRGLDVSVCGDMASDPTMVGHLLQAGIRTLSIAPAALAPVKQMIARWPEDIFQ